MAKTLIVVENFFDNLNIIEEELKKIPLYNLEEMQSLIKAGDDKTGQWPGRRSLCLNEASPFLFNLIVKEKKEKFKNIFANSKWSISSHIHLRLKSDDKNDWIHRDVWDYGMLIYLNNNLQSGTNFYPDDSDEPNMVVKCVKNRAILFNGDIRHRSMKNFGNNIEDGRLTINLFLKKM